MAGGPPSGGPGLMGKVYRELNPDDDDVMSRHEWCRADDVMQCAPPPSGLVSHLTDFLQHLLRLQLLQSQQGQTQLVLLQHRGQEDE